MSPFKPRIIREGLRCKRRPRPRNGLGKFDRPESWSRGNGRYTSMVRRIKKSRRQVSCNLVVCGNAGRPRFLHDYAPDFYPDKPHAPFIEGLASQEVGLLYSTRAVGDTVWYQWTHVKPHVWRVLEMLQIPISTRVSMAFIRLIGRPA